MSRHNGGQAYFGEETWQTRMYSVLGEDVYGVWDQPPRQRVPGSRGHGRIPVLLQKDAHEGERASSSQRGCLCRVLGAVRVGCPAQTQRT